jgi:hypothetical protein
MTSNYNVRSNELRGCDHVVTFCVLAVETLTIHCRCREVSIQRPMHTERCSDGARHPPAHNVIVMLYLISNQLDDIRVFVRAHTTSRRIRIAAKCDVTFDVLSYAAVPAR